MFLTRKTRGSTAWLMLDRPEKMNAMPRSLWREMVATCAEIEADESIRVVIFHGAGRCFSVGGDIDGFGEIGGVEDRRAYMTEALAAYRAVDELPKPVIAAVHGQTLGGGCELSMVCDVVVADETARLGAPETGVGLVPGPGMVRGRAHLNLHWMKYMVLTGIPLDAEQARLAGLVNVVTPAGEHLAEAERLADAMASRSPLAQAAGKAFLGRGAWDDQGYIRELNSLLQGAPDFAEAIAAFKEKRRPDFDRRPDATRELNESAT